MNRVLIFLLVLSYLSPALIAAETPCDRTLALLKEVSTLRKLTIRTPVPCKLESRKEIGEFLKSALREEKVSTRLKNQERTFKAIGLIPKEFEYKDELLKAYSAQVSGYYDPKTKQYVIPKDLLSALEALVGAHELTHALQDQHFDLTAFVDENTLTTDELLARMALVEGDATALMTDFERQKRGVAPLASDDGVNASLMQSAFGLSLTTSLRALPPALRLILVFPYTSGFQFAQTILKSDGYEGLNRAFRNSPTTTTEILHPEKLGAIDVAPCYQKFSTTTPYDSLGEFITTLFLYEHGVEAQQASDAATGLIKDVAVFEGETLQWKLCFSSSTERKQFSAALPKALNQENHDNVVILQFPS